MNIEESERKPDHEFVVIVIATSAKKVEARPHERIGTLKRAAMKAFDIPQDKADTYRLALSPGDPGSEFDDTKTVEDYGLHSGSKIYLVKPKNDA